MILAQSVGYVAVLEGRVMGTALRADFGPHLSTVHMVIVATDHRGQGLGRRLTEAVLATDHPRSYRLIATASGTPIYQKLGFQEAGHILQNAGSPGGSAADRRSV